jgi:3-hydroxyisobutyrate dehydrogenase-like beta-hydroxyacid dehydrogenase
VPSRLPAKPAPSLSPRLPCGSFKPCPGSAARSRCDAAFTGTSGYAIQHPRRTPASSELLIKDLTTALGIGKEAGVPMFFAALASQLYRLAQSMQGPQAPDQSAIKLYEGWAGVENRTE